MRKTLGAVAIAAIGLVSSTSAFSLDDVQRTYALEIDPLLSFVEVMQNPNFIDLSGFNPVLLFDSGGTPTPPAPPNLAGKYGISGTLALDALPPSSFTLHNVSLRATDVQVQDIPSPAGPFAFPTEIDGHWQTHSITFTNAGCVFDLTPGLCMSSLPISFFPSADGTFDGQTLNIIGFPGRTSVNTPQYLLKFRVVADVVSVTAIPEPSTVWLVLCGGLFLLVKPGIRGMAPRRARMSSLPV